MRNIPVNITIPTAPAPGETLQINLTIAPAAPPPPNTPAPGTRGADISLWQKSADWKKVATDIGFVYIKATQGKEIDPMFISHWRGAGGVGLLRGAYHFFTTETPPLIQAQAFCDALAINFGEWGELTMMADVEKYPKMQPISKGAYTEALKIFLDEVERITGILMGIYTSWSKWPELTTEPEWAPLHSLWVANWYAPKPRLPRGWGSHLLWQTGLGLVKGFGLPIDVNKWG